MVRVASVGSINVDRVGYLDAATLAGLTDADWFPREGETRRVESVPESARAHATERFHGGKGANQAVAAARADAGAALYGMVGDDAPEAGVREALDRRGVDVSAVADVPGPTGAAYVFVGPNGENHIAIVGGANEAVDRAYVDHNLASLRAADAVLVQNELPVEASVAALEGCGREPDRATSRTDPDGGGALTVCNPAPVVDAGTLLAAAPDVIVVNEAEHGALAERLGGLPVVVRTRGADPVIVEGREVPDGRLEIVPPAVDPVDTTGAGDVLTGYLATELARGTPLERAVRVAVAAGSLSTEHEGVQRATPATGTVREFLDGT
jgi:ribokinase